MDIQIQENSPTLVSGIVMNLIRQIRHFNEEDSFRDSIRKLGSVMDRLRLLSSNGEQFDMYLRKLYSICLEDATLIPKFIYLICAPALTHVEVHGKRFRHQCINYMLEDYENAEELRKRNPARFLNFISLLGEFLSKKMLDLIREAMLSSLEMLLESDSTSEYKFLMRQVYIRRSILKLEPQSPIILSIRRKINEKGRLCPENVTRLRLIIDIVESKHGILNSDILVTYSKQLGEEEIVELQSHHMKAMNIQIPHVRQGSQLPVGVTSNPFLREPSISPVMDIKPQKNSPTSVSRIVKNLIRRIRHFKEEDSFTDSIRKLRSVMDRLRLLSSNGEQFDMYLRKLYNICLEDGTLIPKFIYLICAPALTHVEVHGKRFRHQCINYMLEDYENAERLRKRNPARFLNFISFLGEFLSKKMLDIIKEAMLSSLEMLLESDSTSEYKFLMRQVYIRRSILKLEPQSPIMLSIRRKMNEEGRLCPKNVTRLRLIIDIVESKHGILNSDLLVTYRKQLGEEEIVELQAHHMKGMNIQIPPVRKVLKPFYSDVPVLLI